MIVRTLFLRLKFSTWKPGVAVASRRITCTFDPPKPNELTAAIRGFPFSVFQDSRVCCRIIPFSSSFSLGFNTLTLMVGTKVLFFIIRAALISPARPEVDSV